MVQRRKWLLDIGDYQSDTAHLSTLAHGAYLLLLMHYFMHGFLPNDDAALRIITRLEPEQWTRLRPILAALFGPGWTHRRVNNDIKAVADYSERKRKAARTRWKKSGEQLEMPVDNSPYQSDNASRAFNQKPEPNQRSDNARASNTSKKESSFFTLPRARTSTSVGGRFTTANKNYQNGNGSALVGRARQTNQTNRKRQSARQRWEAALAHGLAPDAFAHAIDLLTAADPRMIDHITDAELRHAGRGFIVAVELLRRLSRVH